MSRSKVKYGPKRSLRRSIICLFSGFTFITCGTFLFVIFCTTLGLTKYKYPGIEELSCPAPKLKLAGSKPIRNFFYEYKKYICVDEFPHSPAITSDGKSLKRLSVNHINSSSLKCTYTPFERTTNASGIETYKFSSKKYAVKTGRDVFGDFVKTTCSVFGKNELVSKIKHDFFSFIRPKNAYGKVNSKMDDHDGLNIIIMGISGVSRSEFHNYMPETLNYLIEEFEMLEYRYLHSQSKDATKNLIYMLTGNRNKCMEDLTGFVSCRFIFEDLKRLRNYHTAIAEDCVENSEAKFGHLPNNRITDYYWNTFYHAYKDHFGGAHCSLCVNEKISYELVFDYQKRFISQMEKENLPYFGYFWVNSLRSMQTYGRFVDRDYKKLFQFLRDSGLYDRAALLFLSDGAIADSTKNLGISDRVPFFFLYLPKWFQQLQDSPMNLRENQERMITYQDIYKTTVYVTEVNRGFQYGLFDLVDSARDCSDANIDDDVCTC